MLICIALIGYLRKNGVDENSRWKPFLDQLERKMEQFKRGLAKNRWKTIVLPFALVFFVITSMTACKVQKTAEASKDRGVGTQIVFSVVESGSYAGVEDAKTAYIQSAEEWEAWWMQTKSNYKPMPALPNVDFSKHSVIACHMGNQRSGGFKVEVQKIINQGNVLEVHVLHASPGPNCIASMAITQPYQFVKFDKVAATKAEFKVVKKAVPCSNDE